MDSLRAPLGRPLFFYLVSVKLLIAICSSFSSLSISSLIAGLIAALDARFLEDIAIPSAALSAAIGRSMRVAMS